MTHKGSNHRPHSRSLMDRNLSIFHENCRRARFDQDKMNLDEEHEFLRPRMTHNNTDALDRCPDTLELDLQDS